MPVMSISLKGLLHCTGCMTSIENALYAAGATHFDYDLGKQVGRIVFDEKNTNEFKLVDAVKRLGYGIDVLEMEEEFE